MAKANPANLLKLAHADAEKQIEEIKAALSKKSNALLSEVKKELADSFSASLEIFNSIPVEHRKDVLAEPAFDLVLAALGLQPKTEKKSSTKATRTPKAEMTELSVLAFIGKGQKTKGELYDHFSGGNKKVAAFLDTLVKKEKKLTEIEIKGKGKPATGYKTV